VPDALRNAYELAPGRNSGSRNWYPTFHLIPGAFFPFCAYAARILIDTGT